MGKAYLVVRAEVPDQADRAPFDHWYATDHLPGQSGFSEPDEAGGAGAAPTRLSIMPFTNLPISLRRKWRPGPRRSRR